jgi:rubrerythrin
LTAALTPEALEKQWISALDESQRASDAQINSQAQVFSGLVATPQQIAAVIDSLGEVEAHLTSFRPMAEYLRNCDRPALSERVGQRLVDISSARSTYTQMYESSLESARKMAQIHSDHAQDWLKVQQDVLAHRQQVFDDAMHSWSATSTQQCASCGYYLGDGYFYSKICPRCGHLLRA